MLATFEKLLMFGTMLLLNLRTPNSLEGETIYDSPLCHAASTRLIMVYLNADSESKYISFQLHACSIKYRVGMQNIEIGDLRMQWSY